MLLFEGLYGSGSRFAAFCRYFPTIDEGLAGSSAFQTLLSFVSSFGIKQIVSHDCDCAPFGEAGIDAVLSGPVLCC